MKIGICGATQSGKTWLARALADALASVSPRAEISDGIPPGETKTFDLILLMGMDLPSVNPERECEDTLLREALALSGAGFTVVYGRGAARLTNALWAMQARQPAPASPSKPAPAWHWVCDKCSDPVCEHRLFSRLQAG
jgi:hypothetical protein